MTTSPNILFILCDDLNDAISSMGGHGIEPVAITDLNNEAAQALAEVHFFATAP